MKNTVRHVICPLLAALIWGTAFSAQSMCAGHVTAFALNAARAAIACALLLLLCFLRRVKIADFKKLLTAGLCCGAALSLATFVQQLGIEETTAGKAGFITALYVVLVPVLSAIGGKKLSGRVWLAVVLAVAGLYLLCVTENFSVSRGDFLVLICALLFTVQILTVDHYVRTIDGIALSCAQFFFMAVFSAIGMLLFEDPAAQDFSACLLPMLYIAVFSSCVGYTLQIVAQKGGNPTLVSLLLSTESVFAVLGGAVLLGERLRGRELIGCALMLGAVVLAELPSKKQAAA